MGRDGVGHRYEPQWRELFLMHFAESLNVRASAAFAGVPRHHCYNERARNDAFRAAWEEARTEAVELAEAELYRRAVEGVLEPVYWKGKVVGHIRRFNDRLLMFLLQAHDPRYRLGPQVQVNGDAPKVYVSVSPDDL